MPVASFLVYVQTNSKTADDDKETQREEEGKARRPEEGRFPDFCEHLNPNVTDLGSIVCEDQTTSSILEASGVEMLSSAQATSDTSLSKRVLKRLVTYNLNSLIAAIGRDEGRVLEFIENNMADVIALQESMVDPDRPLKADKWRLLPFIRRLKTLGYHVYWHPGSRNSGGYGGTMFLSLQEPEHVIRGTGDELIDSEGRFMALIFSDSIIVNTYTPTLGLDLSGSDKKNKFWSSAEARYTDILKKFPKRPTIWVGDMNVAPPSQGCGYQGYGRVWYDPA